MSPTCPQCNSEQCQCSAASKCPFGGSQLNHAAVANQQWWPDQLNLACLNQSGNNNPDPDFDYAKAFASLDLDQVKKDINKALTTSQDWWPADYGNYGPFFIRLAWHQAGTYRMSDGRGGTNAGNQRFAPLNSWPDNGNLDKARRLLWPIKQKYGRKLSWADLFQLTGNQALETMGLKPFGFGGGRVDTFAPELDVYYGPETEMLASDRRDTNGKLQEPLGASVQGLIYVNPEGLNGEPDPAKAASDIRETFGNMAMNDYETVALIAGGHTFGKAHGAAPDSELGPEPEAAPIEQQNLGYASEYKSGKGPDTITSGLEGAWTAHPTKWDTGYFDTMFKYEWKAVKGPGGKYQWTPKGSVDEADMVVDAHIPGQKHPPMMFTTDLALINDPDYLPIAKNFHENPDELAEAFAKAWYKLTHRDMGPVERLLGKDVPEPQIWQDPIPKRDFELIDQADIVALKKTLLGRSGLTAKLFGSKGLSIPQLVRTAWASASTYRQTDFRGGANGARIRLAPQRDWPVNDPTELSSVLDFLTKVQEDFNKSNGNKRVSIADLIVLGGCAAVEEAAREAGSSIEVPFTPGRTDATEEQTDAETFKVLEPKSDGFRNYHTGKCKAEETLVDRAHLLSLNAPEMAVLVAGMRVLNANTGGSELGVFTKSPGTLTNDFFVNLLDMKTKWEKAGDNEYTGLDRATGKIQWKGTRVDLIFGSHSELRAIAEYYAGQDAKEIFIKDFVKAWTKVMNLDRFDLA